MTSVSEYELLRDKNIKEREALVSTEKVNSSSQVWILKRFKETIAKSLQHRFASFSVRASGYFGFIISCGSNI
jgi:hypothetical protein